MSEPDAKTNEAAKLPEFKPLEVSLSYKGPDFKTLAIGGGMLAGVAHAISGAANAAPAALGTMVPAAAPVMVPEVAAATAMSTMMV